jgi:ATP-dependent RNA helicase A
MVRFVPTPENKKKRKGGDDDGSEELIAAEEQQDANCNKLCTNQYSEQTKSAMAMLSESEVSFELIEAILVYIKGQRVEGSVLVFLPGWNLIFALMKFLQNNPRFSSSEYSILPLHSQLPREDQRRVFDRVAPGVTKIILSTNIVSVIFIVLSSSILIQLLSHRLKHQSQLTTSSMSSTSAKHA